MAARGQESHGSPQTVIRQGLAESGKIVRTQGHPRAWRVWPPPPGCSCESSLSHGNGCSSCRLFRFHPCLQLLLNCDYCLRLCSASLGPHGPTTSWFLLACLHGASFQFLLMLPNDFSFPVSQFGFLSQRTGCIPTGVSFTPGQDIGCWSTLGQKKQTACV